MSSPQNQQTERNCALAWAMTALGGSLFLLGVLRLSAGLIPQFQTVHLVGVCDVPDTDCAPVLVCLKLAGWFVTAGWVVERSVVWQTPLRRWLTAAVRRAQTLLKPPADGVLEVLIGGVLFIVLVLGRNGQPVVTDHPLTTARCPSALHTAQRLSRTKKRRS